MTFQRFTRHKMHEICSLLSTEYKINASTTRQKTVSIPTDVLIIIFMSISRTQTSHVKNAGLNTQPKQIHLYRT